MELGNMIFGNSRGEVSIPRDPSFEGPWRELCDELKLNWYGYADEGCLIPEVGGVLQTDVFAVRSYDWDADCDCGFDERSEAWHEANPHSPECYDSVMDKIMAKYDARTNFKILEAAAFGREDESPLRGFDQTTEHLEPGATLMVFEPRSDAAMNAWREASDLRDKFRDAQRKNECKKRRLSYPAGCAVHCDCDKGIKASEWFEANDHAPTCRQVQPNFLYKPTGLRINWYKYPFRDSYMSPGISPAEWRKIVRHCVDSVGVTRS